MKRSCTITEPERTPLICSEECVEPPTRFSASIDALKSVAQEQLFLWKDFPVFLPESILTVSKSPVTSVFLAHDFDECGLLSKDTDGNLRPLNRHQLRQLRQNAQFDVPSLNFIGEYHTWKVSSFFLKGTNNINLTLKKDLYDALTLLVIHACDRFVSDTFSLRCSFSCLFTDFLRNAVDLLFGWPHINHGDVDHKLLEERLRFITCELSVKSSQRKRVMDFWDAYERLACSPRDVPPDLSDLKHPPYRFITPARIPIDLRLHNSGLLDRCLTIINQLRHPARIGWFQDFKENAISRYQNSGKSLGEIKRLVRQEGLRQYASRLFDALRRDESLKSINNSIAETLVQQATFSLILAEAKDAFTEAWLAYRAKADEQLRQTHCILYHIHAWRARKMARLQEDYFKAHKFDIHELVLSKCMEAHLDQHAFFVSRDLTFLRDRELLLREQLEKSTSFPDTQFIFRIRSELLRYWKVYRKTTGYTTNYRLVDTVVLNRPPTAAEPVPPIRRSIKRKVSRATKIGFHELLDRPVSSGRPPRTEQDLGAPQDFDIHCASPKHPYGQSELPFSEVAPDADGVGSTTNTPMDQTEFVVQSCLVYKTSTRYILWRWLTFLVCTYSWLIRSCQLCFITIPFRSMFSFTILCQSSPIYRKLDLDPTSGYLFPDKSVYQDTLFSRIRRTWRTVRAARRAFDQSPSGGMLDKAATRPWHWIWSYIFRGLLGSLALLVFWPPVCLLVSTASCLIGLTLPVVVPMVSLVLHLLGLLFWDAYKPTSKSNRLFPLFELIIGHFLIRFLLQTVLVLITIFAVYPLCAAVRFLWAFVRFGTRSVWDAVVFHLVIRNLARVPAREDCMVKRIAGPGTASNHFYQASPVHILVMLVGQLELLELGLWKRQLEKLADVPIETYRQLVRGLSWLAVAPKSDGELYASLIRHTKKWHSAVHEKAEQRSRALQLHLKPDQLQRIKLSDRDLHQTLKLGNELTECFFRHRIAPRLSLLDQDPVTWWSAFSLHKNDFLGLCANLLGRTFGEQIFTCIVETDRVFPLQVSDPSLITAFQDFLMDMLGQHTNSVRSLDTVGLPRSDNPSTHHSMITVAVSPADEEAVSLSSDAFHTDLISQRCTVIPAAVATTTKECTDSVLIPADAPTSHGLLNRVSTDKPLAVAIVGADSAKTSLRRAVHNPIAFVHIDLPLFPLSAFAPFSCCDLPLPLKSSPLTPSSNPFPCLDPGPLERRLTCCICLTKAELDRAAQSKLLAQWGKLDSTDGTCLGPCQNSLSSPVVHSGMATLLTDEEQDLRKQLLGWTWNPTEDCDFVQSAHTHDLTHMFLLGAAGPPNQNSSSSLCSSLFKMTSSRSSSRRPPIIAAVEHLGRIYHPAIITLLMHSRDREHNPLDLSHPAVQKSVVLITSTRPKDLGLLRRLRSEAEKSPLRPVYPYPTLLAQSMGSQLVHDSVWFHSSSLLTTPPMELGLPGNAALSHGSLAPENDLTQPLLVHTISEHDRETSNDYLMVEKSPKTVKNHESSCPRLSESNLQHNPAVHPHVNPLVVFGMRETTTVSPDDHWSTVERSRFGTTDQEHESADTTSVSLYGTEDAATTEDLDDSEDALSISSANQCDFMTHLFNDVRCPGGPLPLFDQGVGKHSVLPLAVPELLTTSATTATSADVEVVPDLEANHNLLLACGNAPSAPSLVAESDVSSRPSSVIPRRMNGDTGDSGEPKAGSLQVAIPQSASSSCLADVTPSADAEQAHGLTQLTPSRMASVEDETDDEGTLKTVLLV